MTDQERTAALIGGLRWHDGEDIVRAAQTWRLAHQGAIDRIRPGQWEALLRMGESARTVDEFANAIRAGLTKHNGAEEPERRWPTELLDSMLQEIGEIVKPGDGAQMKAFRRALRKLDGDQGRNLAAGLNHALQTGLACEFVAALVMMIRAAKGREQ